MGRWAGARGRRGSSPCGHTATCAGQAFTPYTYKYTYTYTTLLRRAPSPPFPAVQLPRSCLHCYRPFPPAYPAPSTVLGRRRCAQYSSRSPMRLSRPMRPRCSCAATALAVMTASRPPRPWLSTSKSPAM